MPAYRHAAIAAEASRPLRCRASRLCAWLAACAALLIVMTAGGRGAQAASEGFGPADYIVRFVQYVRWPADSAGEEWRICIAGNAAEAAASYQGQLARGRVFRLIAATTADAATQCQVLDLTALPLAQARPFLEAVGTAPVLSVGNGAEFCSAGGLICLEKGAKEPTFEINLSAVRRSGLQINARLMKLGQRRDAPRMLP